MKTTEAVEFADLWVCDDVLLHSLEPVLAANSKIEYYHNYTDYTYYSAAHECMRQPDLFHVKCHRVNLNTVTIYV